MININTIYKLTANSSKLSWEMIALIIGVIIIILIPTITLIIKRVSLGRGKVDDTSEIEKHLSSLPDLSVEQILDNKKYAFKGAYVIINDTKQTFIVSSSENVSEDLNKHFNGLTNALIYNDYKYGDKFKIKIVNLKDSGYSDLKKLERDVKEVYASFIDNYKAKKNKKKK